MGALSGRPAAVREHVDQTVAEYRKQLFTGCEFIERAQRITHSPVISIALARLMRDFIDDVRAQNRTIRNNIAEVMTMWDEYEKSRQEHTENTDE